MSKILDVVADLTPEQGRTILSMTALVDESLHEVIAAARRQLKVTDTLTDAQICHYIGQLLDVMHQPELVTELEADLNGESAPAPSATTFQAPDWFQRNKAKSQVKAQRTGTNYDA